MLVLALSLSLSHSPSECSFLLPPTSSIPSSWRISHLGQWSRVKACPWHLPTAMALFPVLPPIHCWVQPKPSPPTLSCLTDSVSHSTHAPLILTNLQPTDYIHSVRESLPPANIFIEFHKLGHSWIIYSTVFQGRVHKSLKCWQNA